MCDFGSSKGNVDFESKNDRIGTSSKTNVCRDIYISLTLIYFCSDVDPDARRSLLARRFLAVLCCEVTSNETEPSFFSTQPHPQQKRDAWLITLGLGRAGRASTQ